VIGINIKWVLDQFGVSADEEMVELGAVLMLRFQAAPDRVAFVKMALRRALTDESGTPPPAGKWTTGATARRLR
jgi:hypothetical protein